MLPDGGTMADKTSFKELTREFHYLEDELHRATNWSYRAALIAEMARVIQRLEAITNVELNSIMDEAVQEHAAISSVPRSDRAAYL